ncbi:MAG: FAD binding domain-containing protein [bacterium]|nr:FAD binding domain-containing protein [bacterium]
MHTNIKEFFYPQSVEEAVKLCSRRKLKTVPIAGGTSLSVRDPSSVGAIVDLTRLNLSYIKKCKQYTRIGATTTATEIAESTLLPKPVEETLGQAAAAIASPQLRNRVTIGGNIVQIYPWSDLPAALLVLEARLAIAGSKKRTAKITDFLKEHPSRFLKKGEIVTEIRIPHLKGNIKGGFVKVTRSAVDNALVDVACILHTSCGVIDVARVAVSSVTRLPERLTGLEKLLLKKKVSPALLAQVEGWINSNLKVTRMVGVSASYRKKLAAVTVRRLIADCLKK